MSDNSNITIDSATETLISYLTDNRLVVTTRFIPLLLTTWPGDFKIDFSHSFLTAQRVVDFTAIAAGTFDVSDGFDINTIPPPPPDRSSDRSIKYDLTNLTTEEEEFLRCIFKAIQRPTEYLTPNGPLTINYDCDLAHYILKYRAGTRGFFYEYQFELIDHLERSLYMLHFM